MGLLADLAVLRKNGFNASRLVDLHSLWTVSAWASSVAVAIGTGIATIVRLRVHGDLAEDRADAVRQRRDQARGLPFLVLRAADGLAVDRDYQTAAGLRGPGVQPGTEDPVEHVGADQGERAPEGGLLRRAPSSAEPGQHLRAGLGGPLPDRGERPRPRDHRRDPDGEQAAQRVTAAPFLPGVRDLGKEIRR